MSDNNRSTLIFDLVPFFKGYVNGGENWKGHFSLDNLSFCRVHCVFGARLKFDILSVIIISITNSQANPWKFKLLLYVGNYKKQSEI